jgi:hypothetical protein
MIKNTETHSEYVILFLLLFYYDNGYTNAHQCFVVQYVQYMAFTVFFLTFEVAKCRNGSL